MKRGIKNFLDAVEERHALTIGLCEVICPWPPRNPLISATYKNTLQTEHHYYQIGRATGVFVWLGLLAIIKEIIF